MRPRSLRPLNLSSLDWAETKIIGIFCSVGVSRILFNSSSPVMPSICQSEMTRPKVSLLQFLNCLPGIVRCHNSFEPKTVEHEAEYVPHARDIVDDQNTY